MELEHPFLRTPCDGAMKLFRASKKYFDKEIEALIKDVGGNRRSQALAPADVPGLVVRLRGLKRKLNALQKDERTAVRLCRLRITHVRLNIDNIQAVVKKASSKHSPALPPASQEAASLLSTDDAGKPDAAAKRPPSLNHAALTETLPRAQWNILRLQRILADYMLREGLYRTAKAIIAGAGISDLVDVDVFKTSRKVTEALAAHDCSEALKWCADNKRRLAKCHSQLEFRLRVQEFVEKRRKGSLKEAIVYARKYLASMAKDNLKEVQETMALLAYGPETTCKPYNMKYDAARWDDLIALFTAENYQLHGLTRESVLEISLKIGVAVMRTQYCSEEESRKVNCPTCSEPFNQLAENLPISHHIHSALVCRVLGTPMNENNPPMVLPNLNVYSEDALQILAAAGGGKVTDPRTGEVFRYPSELIRKAFIM